VGHEHEAVILTAREENVRITALWLAAAAISSSALSAQIPPPPQKGAPPERAPLKTLEHAVVVTGCIRGTRLEIADSMSNELPAEVFRASEFVLEGPRELLTQIRREHNGHRDEIAGIAVIPPMSGRGTASVTTKEAGRVRLGVGVREEQANMPDPPRPVRLRVQSLTHVSEGCVSRR
jgi:hypothetical protein